MVLGRVGFLKSWHGANVGELAVFCLAFPYLISFAHFLALVRLYPVAAQCEFLGGTFPFAFSRCLFGLGACHALGECEAGLAAVEADVALWVGVAVG